MPEQITGPEVAEMKARTTAKKVVPYLEEVALFRLEEGLCVQMLHTGPFDREPETLEAIQAFTTDYGFIRNGLHHEIYLSDFRKTSPDKLRTILREPIRKA